MINYYLKDGGMYKDALPITDNEKIKIIEWIK